MERIGGMVFDMVAYSTPAGEVVTSHSAILDACIEAFFTWLFSDED